MICKECQKEGKTSNVYPQGGSATLMYCPPFYDEKGLYHNHDPNRHTDYYICSNGHKWTESYLRSTTSYEMSKKLYEIGFKTNNCGGWFYDFETIILEALPLIVAGVGMLKIGFMPYPIIGYGEVGKFQAQMTCYKQSDESLANTAARLLILLHEKGIVKFND